MVKSPPSLGTLTSRIQAGTDRLVRLEHAVADSKLTGDRTADTPPSANGTATVDPRAAVRNALMQPLEFPPLAKAVVPGDSVAIAVDENVPCIAEVVRGAIDALEEAGVALDAVAVVTGDSRARDLCREALGSDMAGAIRFVVHDPEDPLDLCFVGVTNKQRTLRFNRAIYDADVVLPIGCARLAGIGGGGGVFDCLFPRFCDAESIRRFRSPAGLDSAAGQAAARREADEAGWLLGAAMVVEVVPGTEGNVAAVVAGEPSAVAAHVKQLGQQLWSFHVPQRASLVVANVAGGPLEQSWDNVARALAAAERLVDDDGAVAICTALDRPPGKSLGRLVDSDDLADVERKARHDHAPDSWSAWQLARALQRGPVYLLSRLDDETVEDMGLAPVSEVEDLVRLASRHESCIVLDESQHSLVTVKED